MKKYLVFALVLMLCGCSSAETAKVSVTTVPETAETEPEMTAPAVSDSDITTQKETTVSETTAIPEETTAAEASETTADTSVSAEDTSAADTTLPESAETAMTTSASEKPDIPEAAITDPSWKRNNLFKCGLVPVRVPDNPGDNRWSDNDKYGYADKNGNIVIKPEWDIAWEFSDIGIAVVGVKQDNGYSYKYGFIDTKGNVIVEPQYDAIGTRSQYDNLIDITEFSYDRIRVTTYDFTEKEDWKDYTEYLYFVDHLGNRISDYYNTFWWPTAEPVGTDFSQSLAGVIKKSDKKLKKISYGKTVEIEYYDYSFIDTSGEKVFSLDYPLYDYAKIGDCGSFPNYRISEFNKYGWAVLDSSDDEIPQQLIYKNGKLYPVTAGNDSCCLCGDGYYFFSQKNEDNDTISYLRDKNNNTLLTVKMIGFIDDDHISITDETGKIGIASPDGKWYFEPQFDRIFTEDLFNGVLCFVVMGNSVYTITDDLNTYLLTDNFKISDTNDYYSSYYDAISRIILLYNGFSYTRKPVKDDSGEKIYYYDIYYEDKQVYSGKMPVVYADGYFIDSDDYLYSSSGKIKLPENYYPSPSFRDDYGLFIMDNPQFRSSKIAEAAE
ncbi:MAG: WG repeat-containing protein [Oscillospiraceae bacterium]|nr:WG repeat-containing protein [Oscillospiraceae bacterium]